MNDGSLATDENLKVWKKEKGREREVHVIYTSWSANV